ncbi:MAG: beta-lactamase family protein [Acidobacteria bacterium]|jgi:CubicO group peptidase (beta-lactamase class C family)|nr:beta-lactamase family protein [Acidobacteriota bacterium]
MKNALVWTIVATLVLSIFACGGDETADPGPGMNIEDEVYSELARLANGDGEPGRELSGLAVAVLRDGEVTFEATFGRAYIDPEEKIDRKLTPDSLMRIASVSKTLSTIVVLQLVEEGKLELDRDVSEYLGWKLRNPHYPDRAITLRDLLSHVSSIRDAGESYIIRYPSALQEAFDPHDRDYGERFQIAEEGRDRGPGVFFEYCNLNYGVVGTILEKVTGVRFDHLMKQRFFEPLGLAGGFNVAGLSEVDQKNLATLYRKRDRENTWDPDGPWFAQVDDLSEGIPTALPEGAEYVPGTNGAQFSPQGGARMSLRGLETLAKIFAGDGSVGAVRILSPASMDEMRSEVWRYDPAKENFEDYAGKLNAWATGIRMVTSETAGDRLFPGDARRWYGHFGEAYGLLAGVWAHPESGDGLIFALTGTAFDPEAESDGSSTLTPIEARILEQLARLL